VNTPPPKGGGFKWRLKPVIQAESPDEFRLMPTVRLFVYPEIIVFLMRLIFNVSFYFFVSYISTGSMHRITAAATKISPRPKMSTPKLLPQMLKFSQQKVRTFSFNPLHKATNRNVRRNWYQDMHMFRKHVSFQYIDFVLAALVPNYISDTISRFAFENFTSVFCDPYNMQMNRKYSMWAVTIFFTHQLIIRLGLLKLSPKGEGFTPNWRQ